MTTANRFAARASAQAVLLLGVTQNVGYGTLYYGFAVLAGDVAATFGWPVSWIFAAFSLALLAGGLVAPFAGRSIDRHGAGPVMAAGSVAAAAALAAVALAPTAPAFVLAIVLAQVVSTFVLYDAAFTCLVQIAGPDGRRRIVHLTLIAGFASTIFWPLTTGLHDWLSWRQVFALFAAMNLLVCAPAHLILARLAKAAAPADTVAAPAAAVTAEAPLPPEKRRTVSVLVTIGFAVGGFLLSGVLAQMVPLLGAVGLGEAAVAVAALFGPSQVVVRFVTMTVGASRHPVVTTLLASFLLPASVVVLTATAPHVAGAAAFAILLGFGSGLTSIVRGTLPLVLFGSAAYGERLGRMAAVRLVLTSIAPFVLAVLVDSVGTGAALMAMAATGVFAFACFLAVARFVFRASVPRPGG